MKRLRLLLLPMFTFGIYSAPDNYIPLIAEFNVAQNINNTIIRPWIRANSYTYSVENPSQTSSQLSAMIDGLEIFFYSTQNPSQRFLTQWLIEARGRVDQKVNTPGSCTEIAPLTQSCREKVAVRQPLYLEYDRWLFDYYYDGCMFNRNNYMCRNRMSQVHQKFFHYCSFNICGRYESYLEEVFSNPRL